jgi:alpha-beta hydrolase superfamily lysophospholipase
LQTIVIKEVLMMKKCLVLFLFLLTTISMAQEAPTPTPSPAFTPQKVEVSATDGLTLKGDFYLLDASKPTVLMLHQLYATRTAWNGLDGALLGAGFNVLAVDLRGYGKTGGGINWGQAVTDVQTWIDWLRNAGVDGNKIITLGSSMGSVLAIAGCGNDSACATAIAISPAMSYYTVDITDALQEQLSGRKVLVIYAERDRYPALGVPKMLEIAPDIVTVLKFSGNTHGINLVKKEFDIIAPKVVEWVTGYAG